MKTDTLASLIVDCQDSIDPDELISFSAKSDNMIIRTYFCDPNNGVSILKDYADEKLADLFLECDTLEAATAKVSKLYHEQPLESDELKAVQAACTQAVLNATYAIANNRGLGGCRHAHESIVSMVVVAARHQLDQFQQ